MSTSKASVIGTIVAYGSETGPEPTEFVAVTVNVYPVPFVSPLTVQVSVPVV